MKGFLLLVAAAMVAGAMYVAAAQGSQQTAGPTAKQFAALKKQVAALQKQVKSAKAAADGVALIVVDCMLHQTVGVSQNGDPGGTFGYSYTNSQSATSLTTALDLASSSPTYTLLTLNPNPQLDCASLVGAGGLKHFGGVARSIGHR